MFKIQLHKILNVEMCWDILRSTRWSEGVVCPCCGSSSVVKNGKDTAHPNNQHYHCKSCGKYFDDLTDTVFSDSKQPLHHWITVMYMMHLNASNRQIAQELEISEDTAQRLCSVIREGVVKKNLIYNLADVLRLTSVMSLQDKRDNPTK